MTSRSSLVVALAVVAVVGIGVGVAQLGLRDDGIEFPDGTVQTTAAGLLGAPLQGHVLFGIPELSFCATGSLYTVPPGKRLLIEWMSAEVFLTSAGDAPVSLDVRTWLGGVDRLHSLVRLENFINFGESFFFKDRWNSSTTLYSQGGQTVEIFACRNTDSDSASVIVTFHGQLLDQ